MPTSKILAKIIKAARTVEQTINATLRELPNKEGPPRVEKAQVWSAWWLLAVLLALLTVEWLWRRRLGLA